VTIKEIWRHFVTIKEIWRHFVTIKEIWRHFVTIKEIWRHFVTIKEIWRHFVTGKGYSSDALALSYLSSVIPAFPSSNHEKINSIVHAIICNTHVCITSLDDRHKRDSRHRL
jgi:hypothetical protein